MYAGLNVLFCSSSRYSLFAGNMRNVTTGYVIGQTDLADNSEHQVEIKQTEANGSTLTLYVDVDKKLIEIPGFYSRRLAHQTFYVGGVDLIQRRKRHWYLREILPYVPFEGCLDNQHVKINGINLLDLARKGNASVSGKLTPGCNIASKGYNPITFKRPKSFIKLNVPVMNTASYSVKFRTYIGQGILLHQRATVRNGANIILSLDSGRVKLEFALEGKSVPLRSVLAGLDDGMWHSVIVDISAKRVTLTVDNKESSADCDGSFVTSSEVFAGGNEWGKNGFVGCMRDLIVQGQNISLRNLCRTQVCRNECSLPDLCVPNPCRNRGRCSQQWNQSVCDCSGTDFTGAKCEKPAFFMQSCADWYAAGKRTNAYYRINPRHSEPFAVYCNMTNIRGPSTVIFHTRHRNKVIAARNNRDGKYYQHEIIYENSNDQNIRDLISSSTHCRQYLQYKCYNSVIFDSPKTFHLKSGRGARWVSRDGQLQDYWSGSSEGSMKCACGMNGTCVERNKVCNCDTTDNKWHTDDGYLTNLRHLPVKKLLFSVDGTSAKSYYILGSLECYGSTTIRTTTTDFAPNGSFTTPNPTALESTKQTAKSPSTSSTGTSGRKGHTNNIQVSTVTSNLAGTLHDSAATTEPQKRSTTHTQESLQPHVIVIEATRRYITIRENANQQLVLIILSVILAVFVIAILLLIVKQNLFYPCKCLKVPFCHEVPNSDTIELRPPSPAEPEILQLEASPYPARNYHIVSHDGRDSPSLEIYSDAETDRLDISNGSSTWNSENADMEKEKSEKRKDFEDIDLGLIDLVPFPGCKQFSTEQQILKLKEVLYDVLTAADVTATYSDKNKNTTNPTKRCQEVAQCRADVQCNQPLLTEDKQLGDSNSDSTASISDISSTIENSPDISPCNEEIDVKSFSKESSEENAYKSARDKGSLTSSDPHDNYLSLDVDSLESGTLRQPLNVANLNGNCSYDEQLLYDNGFSHRRQKQAELQNVSDGKYLKKNMHRHSSPRSHLFSRQKSEEESLLSSNQASRDIPSRGNCLLESRCSGVSNTFHHTKQPRQQQQQYPNGQENQIKERYKTPACAMPLKHSRAQKYETEL